MWIKPNKPKTMMVAFLPETWQYDFSDEHDEHYRGHQHWHCYSLRAYWVTRTKTKFSCSYGIIRSLFDFTPESGAPIEQPFLTYEDHLKYGYGLWEVLVSKTYNKTWTVGRDLYDMKEIEPQVNELLYQPDTLPPGTDGWYAYKNNPGRNFYSLSTQRNQ